MNGVVIPVLIAVVVFIGAAVAIRASRSMASTRSRDKRSGIVTSNLDYSILGQRPEIVTEDDPDFPPSA